MLTIKFIRENKEKVIHGLTKKHFDKIELVDKVIELDEIRRQIQQSLFCSIDGDY